MVTPEQKRLELKVAGALCDAFRESDLEVLQLLRSEDFQEELLRMLVAQKYVNQDAFGDVSREDISLEDESF